MISSSLLVESFFVHSIITLFSFVSKISFSIIFSILQKTYVLNIFQNIFIPFFKLFNINTEFISPFLTGLLELTNGVTTITTVTSKNLTINVITCAFLLGFGGISIMLQVLSIISKSDISIKPYILGKLLHGTLAAFYTFIIINNFSYFNYLNL